MHQEKKWEVLLAHRPPSSPDPTDLMTAAACEESGGSVPAMVIIQAEETDLIGPDETSEEQADPQKPGLSDRVVLAAAAGDPSQGSTDGGDMTCSDLLSLKSDSTSLASQNTTSRRSEEGQEDDTKSVATSSVMSLFHRVQLDPQEKDWMRSSVLGNMAAQRHLLSQEPSLILKKTALHWAAKQGRQEAVDMMLRSGADVNARSGYTALHLASIHGHQQVVQSLINTYNANTSVRDYHGKTAVQYWSGCTDIFIKADSPSGGRFSHGRWTQRYVLSSRLLSRSRSQGQLTLDFGAVPQSDTMDIHI